MDKNGQYDTNVQFSNMSCNHPKGAQLEAQWEGCSRRHAYPCIQGWCRKQCAQRRKQTRAGRLQPRRISDGREHVGRHCAGVCKPAAHDRQPGQTLRLYKRGPKCAKQRHTLAAEVRRAQTRTCRAALRSCRQCAAACSQAQVQEWNTGGRCQCTASSHVCARMQSYPGKTRGMWWQGGRILRTERNTSENLVFLVQEAGAIGGQVQARGKGRVAGMMGAMIQ